MGSILRHPHTLDALVLGCRALLPVTPMAVTRLWFTEHTAPGFQNRIVVIMNNRGHTEWEVCVETLYRRFLNQGSIRGLDASLVLTSLTSAVQDRLADGKTRSLGHVSPDRLQLFPQL